MKKTGTIKFCGNFGTVLVIIAVIFKIQHYPFHNELMTIGLVSFAVFWIWTLVKIFMINRPLIYKTVWSVIVLIVPIIGSWVYYHLELKK